MPLGTGSDQERGPWSGVWTLIALTLVGFIVIESGLGIARDTDPNKWGWGSALVVGLVGAFSLIRNLFAPGRAGEPNPVRWWHGALAFALLFSAIAVKALTFGESVLAAIGYASVYFLILGIAVLGVHLYQREE
jgi:hypothetical protein